MPDRSDSTSVTRIAVPGRTLFGTYTVAGIFTGPADLSQHAGPAGPAGQLRSTVAAVGRAYARTRACRVRASTENTYCAVPPGSTVASGGVPGVPVSRLGPTVGWPGPAIAGIATRNSAEVPPQKATEPMATAITT